jgi:hypothetical protein
MGGAKGALANPDTETIMASQAPANLPLFYNNLMPLSSRCTATTRLAAPRPLPFSPGLMPFRSPSTSSSPHSVSIRSSSRSATNPVPLALMGLNEGVNVFVDDEGKLLGETYVPAYIRRYPFMLAGCARCGRAVALLRSGQRARRRIRRRQCALHDGQ